MNYFDSFYQFKFLYPFAVPLYHSYVKALTTAHKRKSSLKFLRGCLSEQVVPKSMRIKLYSNICGSPFPQVYRCIILDRICVIKREVNLFFFKASSALRRLSVVLPPQVIPTLVEIAHRKAMRNVDRLSLSLERKMNSLCLNSLWTRNLQDGVLNISDYQLSVYEREVLCLGINFHLGHSKSSVLEYLNSINKHPLRNLFTADIFKREQFRLPRRFFLALKSLKINENIIIKRSDKGGKGRRDEST